MPNLPKINPGVPPLVVPVVAPVLPVAPDESASAQGGSADIAIMRVHIVDGAPKALLQPSDANFLRAPRTGDLDFRLAQRYRQLRENYVAQRVRPSEGLFDTQSVYMLKTLSSLDPSFSSDPARQSNLNAVLRSRADYMTQCFEIATECHMRSPLPLYPVLEKIERLLDCWDDISSMELLAFEEELLACVDITSKMPHAASSLHGYIWALKSLEVADPRNKLPGTRDSLQAKIEDVRERLIELTFSAWHLPDDPVAPSLPPEKAG